MSSFGINLDLSVRGQDKFQRAIRTVEQLEAAVKRASKELDLSAKLPGRGAEADRIGTLTKRMNDLAKKLVDTGQSGKTTQAGISDLTSSFKSLARISDVTKGSFKNFVEATVVAEKEVEKLARAEENARRAFLGMQTLEEREAQLERRANTLRNLRTRKKIKEQEARAREENARAIKREADAAAKLNRQNERDAKLAKQRKSKARGRAIGDLAASVGFPLLFGGGIGSVAGGAIGSIAGSAAGIGFGAQILGSALGGSLEEAARAASQFATTLTSARTAVDQLIDAVGVRRTDTATSSRFAQTLGIGGVARAGLQSELAGIVGDKGVKSLEALADSSAEAANSVSQFGAKVTAAFAPVLTTVNKTISAVLGGSPAVKRLEQKEKDLAGLKKAGSQGFAIARLEAEIAQLRRDSSDELERQAVLLDAIDQVKTGIVDLEKETLDVENSRLIARRDDFALAQGNLAVSRLQQELLLVELELNADISDERKEQLKLQKQILGVQIDTANAAKENARIQAERAIARDVSSNEQAILQTFQNIGSVQRASLKITELEGEAFERNQTILKGESQLRIEGLELQREQALVGKIEQEVRDGINEKYDLAIRLERQRTNLQLEQNRQAEVLRQNREQEIKDNRELLRLETERNAMLQIRSMDFGRKFELSGAGLGFFGESENFQEETFARSAAQLEAYNEQIGRLQQRIQKLNSEGVDPDIIRGQQFKLDDLIAVRDTFKEIQPAIDAAAVAQARFTDAMAVTVPVTDALFTNLVAVVQGTKTAEEAFASFLQSVAKMLMDVATQMIATYMAIGIARAFAGMGGGDGGAKMSTTQYFNPKTGLGVAGPNFGLAEGGFVSGPTRALIGEGGESEYVIPESKMRESMARYSRGARGSSVIPETGASGTSGEGGGVAVAAPIDVRYSIERINNIDYVTNDQFQQGLQQAAAQGAQRGEQNTLKRLQMSGSTRRRLGM